MRVHPFGQSSISININMKLKTIYREQFIGLLSAWHSYGIGYDEKRNILSRLQYIVESYNIRMLFKIG